MWVRSGGFYPSEDPPEPQLHRVTALVILPVLVAVVGAAIVLIARALLLTAGR
jgi:hypothetical protein